MSDNPEALPPLPKLPPLTCGPETGHAAIHTPEQIHAYAIAYARAALAQQAATPAPANPVARALPELPVPRHRGPDGTGSYFNAYTADQMRAFARATLAQQAGTPPLKPQDGDDDDLRLALDLIDKIKTAETNGGLLSAVMLYRFEIRKRCIAAAARQAATPAPAEPVTVPAGWRLVPDAATHDMLRAAAPVAGSNPGRIYRAMIDAAPLATPAAPPLTTCNCRWNGDKLVQQCTLHEAWRDAIHDWARRAKEAEAKLAAPAAQPECVTCVRCGHENWIQEGRAMAQVKAPATPAAQPADEEAESRLVSLLAAAGLDRHPAMTDLARLIFARKERDRLLAAAPSTPAAQPADEREAFEAWLGRDAFTERSDTGKYVSAHVDAMWSAWQARAALEGDGWIAVADRLPEPATDVLVYVNDRRICVAGIFNGFWQSFDRPWRGMSVTHWRPLPAAPSDGSRG